jgi:hypothetical protein
MLNQLFCIVLSINSGVGEIAVICIEIKTKVIKLMGIKEKTGTPR